MVYAVFDKEGFPRGFYADGIHQEIPAGAERISEEQWRDFLDHPGERRWDGANVVPGKRAAVEILTTQEQVTRFVQQMLDARARAKGYEGILAACSYDNDPDPTFAVEGSAFKAWRSAAWKACFTILSEQKEVGVAVLAKAINDLWPL